MNTCSSPWTPSSRTIVVRVVIRWIWWRFVIVGRSGRLGNETNPITIPHNEPDRKEQTCTWKERTINKRKQIYKNNKRKQIYKNNINVPNKGFKKGNGRTTRTRAAGQILRRFGGHSSNASGLSSQVLFRPTGLSNKRRPTERIDRKRKREKEKEKKKDKRQIYRKAW